MKIVLALLVLVLTAQLASAAEDWGSYAIVPVSAPSLVLEAVGAGTADGTVVSINTPAGRTHQKWSIVAREGGLFAIRPAHDPTLALAVEQRSSCWRRTAASRPSGGP